VPASPSRRWLEWFSTRRVVASQDPVHPEIQFEESDIRGLRVFFAGVVLIGAIWAVVVVLYPIFGFWAQHRASVAGNTPPMEAAPNTLPPAPRLQVTPEVDLEHLRAFENSQLHSYGWADRPHGVITIPVDRAMQILASRGIPPQKAPASLKLSVPTAGTRRTGFEGKVEPEPR
jgi:hypothetical protein